MVDQIINYFGANNIIAALFLWNVVGAFYHYKWEKKVNKALFEH
jgi:hypothetical protein